RRLACRHRVVEIPRAEHPSSAAGPAGDTLYLGTPECRPGRLQRLVRPDILQCPHGVLASAWAPSGSLDRVGAPAESAVVDLPVREPPTRVLPQIVRVQFRG